MARTRTLSTALLLGLLAMLIVGLPGDGEQAEAAPDGRATIHKLVIPAAAFAPAYDGFDYVNGGDELSTLSGFAGYIAPVQFPYPVVTVKSITLHVYDNGSQDVQLHLGRSRPSTGAGAIIATVKSTGQSTTQSRAFSTTAISPRIIDRANHGAYLALYPPPGTSYNFYGVTIRFEA